MKELFQVSYERGKKKQLFFYDRHDKVDQKAQTHCRLQVLEE